ncbi:MAG: UvrD-helicase domain-containing protein [Clostridia bacterium]|nr:UvrD-helicase domain-containing protein [Clostridia bacterium]
MARTWTASQEAAMNLRGRTLLVSAAAGSGKTSVLTERIIRSLLDNENPADLSRMLIVTFTRAAAAELKSRIASALTEALAQNPGNKHLSHQLFLLGSAQISTIDAFFQKTVKANFEALSLPASFRLADESEILPIKIEIMDSLIEEYYRRYASKTDSSSAFDRIHNNPFAEALDHLLSTRSDGKLNSVLMKFGERFSADPAGVRRLKICAEELRSCIGLEYFTTSYGMAIKEYLTELFDSHLSYLSCVTAHLDATPDMKLKFGGIVESDTQYCLSMKQALDENCYERVRTLCTTFISGTFPRSKEKTEPIIEYQEWRGKFKTSITKKVQEILNVPSEQISLQMERTASLLEMLYLFYTEYHALLMSEKRERSVLEFDDVRSMLYGLLTREDGSPSLIAEQLSAQYDAVYIDEYQDVDQIQDRIFALIGKNRRFMVGDIKQSIYGFRGSAPSIFAGYRRTMPLYTDDGADSADGNCVFMSENFRCDEPVIHFANRVCSFLFSACESSVGYRPQDDLVCSKPIPDDLPNGHPVPVQVAVFDAPPSKKQEAEEDCEDVREEAVWIAAEISRLLQNGHLDSGAPIRAQDIAILVRTRAHGDTYSEELEKLNIPVSSATSGSILQEPILTDMLNLLRTIDNPYRDLPLSEFLLSALGGFTLEELTDIRDACGNEMALYDALATRAVHGDALAEKCRRTIAMLEKHSRNASIQPADRFLRLLYLEEMLSPYARTPALLFLYDQARIYQRTSYCGLYGFLNYITKLTDEEKLSADGFKKAENAVTIMTVHHSKGLEFPVVFLASAASAFNKDDMKRNLIYHQTVGCAARLYNRETGESEDTALRTAVKIAIDREQTEESIRTLYVALTRARERLYVTGTLRGKWESTVTAAHLIRRGDRPSILGASNSLLWILAAIFEDSDNTHSWQFTHFERGSVNVGIPLQVTEAEVNAPAAADGHMLHYAEICRRRTACTASPSILHALPTKVAASKLTYDLLDRLTGGEDDTVMLEAQIDLMKTAIPSFDTLLSEEEKPSAADIGTATHAFLEYCDFHALSVRSVAEESARLLEEDFITEQTHALLNIHQLEQFRESDLMLLIRQAKRIRREQKFGLLIPMETLTENGAFARTLEGQQIFVQGSIDLLLEMSDSRLILIDYKTDHILDEERSNPLLLQKRMQCAHGEQLACYAMAVRELFGKAPDEIRIYSLPLGRTLPISVEEYRKLN